MKATVDKLSDRPSEKLSEGSSERSSKPNKRTQALKGILEKQGIEAIPEAPIKGAIEIANPSSGSRIVTFGAEVINPLASSAASIPPLDCAF